MGRGKADSVANRGQEVGKTRRFFLKAFLPLILSESMSSIRQPKRRAKLLRDLERQARRMVFGTLSETSRTCGQPTCRCHHGGPKHGPHRQISFHGNSGKTTGYHVPKSLAPQVRQGVTAWKQFQKAARQLAELNRKGLWEIASARKARR